MVYLLLHCQVPVYSLRYPRNHLEGQDGDSIEDSEPGVLQGKIKDLVELAMRMSEVTKSTSEWHRRMTAQNLGQNGRKIHLDTYAPGTKVFFYKPPSAIEAEKHTVAVTCQPARMIS